MKQTGTVQGEAARRYRMFCYRKAILQPIDALTVHEHTRLRYDQEYPRYLNPPTHISMKTVDLCDYEVVFVRGPWRMQFTETLQVRLLPNDYTWAKEPKVIWSANVANSNLHHKEYIDKALKEVFGGP